MSTEAMKNGAGATTFAPGASALRFIFAPVFTLALALTTLLPPVAGANDASATSSVSESTTPTLAALDGRWRRLEIEPDDRRRLEAIDAAVEPLTWVVRKMAGGVLRSTTAPHAELHFVWDGRKLYERVPGRHGVETRLVDPEADSVKAVDSRGEPFEGEWRWTAEGLRFRWRQHQAHGENLIRLDASRRTLTVDHSIVVTALDGVRPIAYRSHFARIDLPAVSGAGPDAPDALGVRGDPDGAP